MDSGNWAGDILFQVEESLNVEEIITRERSVMPTNLPSSINRKEAICGTGQGNNS